MSCMRATYLLEIARLKEHIFTKYGQHAIGESKDATLPRLRLLSTEDYIVPADIPLPLEQAVACAKARIEMECNAYAHQLHKRIEELCETLHQKAEQASKQAELFDRLWSARQPRSVRRGPHRRHNRRTASLHPPDDENSVSPSKVRALFDSDHGSASLPTNILAAGSSTLPAKFLKSVWRRTFTPNKKEIVERSMTAPEIIGCDGSGKFSFCTPKRGGESPESPGPSGNKQAPDMFTPMPVLGSRHGQLPGVLLGKASNFGEMCKATKLVAPGKEDRSVSLPASPSHRLQELRPPPICTGKLKSTPRCTSNVKSPARLDEDLFSDETSPDQSPASSMSELESPNMKSTSSACKDNLRHPQQSIGDKGACHFVVDVRVNEHGSQPSSPGSIPHGIIVSAPSDSLK